MILFFWNNLVVVVYTCYTLFLQFCLRVFRSYQISCIQKLSVCHMQWSLWLSQEKVLMHASSAFIIVV